MAYPHRAGNVSFWSLHGESHPTSPSECGFRYRVSLGSIDSGHGVSSIVVRVEVADLDEVVNGVIDLL